MRYCTECGTQIEEGALFCSECGTKVDDDFQQENEDKGIFTSNSSTEEKAADFVSSTILFTNIARLAATMDVSEEDVNKALQWYIEQKANYGYRYKLVDAGNYTFHKKKHFWESARTVSLNHKSTVRDHVEILLDVHEHEEKKGGLVSEYLFIVGGHEVIPMPCIKHYIPNDDHDKDIDTDLLYTYLSDKDMRPLLESQDLFNYDQTFWVGRLPFGKDASFEDLCSYLERNIASIEGVPMSHTYGQTDPNWKNVSAKTITTLMPTLPNLDGQVHPECYYQRLMLSPFVTSDNVEQVFNPKASLYFFNLHGSNALNTAGYVGVERNGKRACMAILPKQWTTCEMPNIVMTEACYGARFIGYDKAHSMLLSAIHAETLAFVGSSRVAWGAIDGNATSPQQVRLGNADMLTTGFVQALHEGYNVGQALHIGRMMCLKASKVGNLHAALTVVEFNLYGDPTVRFKQTQGKTASVDVKAFLDANEPCGCEVEEIITAKRTEQSILERVRSAVNANIEQMHNIVSQQLYEQYGIESRPIDGLLKVKYADGTEAYQWTYKTQTTEAELPVFTAVETTTEGKLTYVWESK